jgi:hypothetical protein
MEKFRNSQIQNKEIHPKKVLNWENLRRKSKHAIWKLTAPWRKLFREEEEGSFDEQ